MSICLVKVLSELYLTTRQTVRVLYSNSLSCHRFVNCMVWFYLSVHSVAVVLIRVVA